MTFNQFLYRQLHSWLSTHPLVFSTYMILLCWWTYLGLTTHHFIIFDSEDFMRLGNLLSNHTTIIDYFVSGPNREPLYPVLIAIALNMSKLFHCSFQLVYNVIAIILLLITVVTMHRLCIALRFPRILTISVIAYTGLSPITVNSAFSIYSESLASLLLLLVAFNYGLLYQAIKQRLPLIKRSSYFALCLLSLTLVKGVGEIIALITLASIAYFLLREKINIKPLLLALCIFYIPLLTLKTMNYVYNHHFALTNRALETLYVNITRRSNIPLNTENILSKVSTIVVSKDLCGPYFKYDTCHQWSMSVADDTAILFSQSLREQNIPESAQRSIMQHKIFNNFFSTFPAQIVYGILEGARMFFSETSQGSFVAYPKWIELFANSSWCANFFALMMGGVFLIGFCVSVYRNFRNSNYLISSVIIVLVIYSTIFSFSNILHRYTIPCLPLLIILLGYALSPRDTCSLKVVANHDQKHEK